MKNKFAFIQSLEMKELLPQEPKDSLHLKLLYHGTCLPSFSLPKMSNIQFSILPPPLPLSPGNDYQLPFQLLSPLFSSLISSLPLW